MISRLFGGQDNKVNMRLMFMNTIITFSSFLVISSGVASLLASSSLRVIFRSSSTSFSPSSLGNFFFFLIKTLWNIAIIKNSSS